MSRRPPKGLVRRPTPACNYAADAKTRGIRNGAAMSCPRLSYKRSQYQHHLHFRVRGRGAEERASGRRACACTSMGGTRTARQVVACAWEGDKKPTRRCISRDTFDQTLGGKGGRGLRYPMGQRAISLPGRGCDQGPRRGREYFTLDKRAALYNSHQKIVGNSHTCSKPQTGTLIDMNK